MPLLTRAVFGFVYRTDGTPLAAVPITIRAYPNVFQPDGSVAPTPPLAPITNSVGRYDVVLVVNARYLIGIPGDVFEIIVPSGAGSISVESLRATTGVVMSNAVQIALEAVLAVHAALTTTAHGGLVAAGDGRLTNARTPTGSAGGVLSGTYPSPSFAADMATQAELDAALLLKENALGTPDVSGKVLTSTVGGLRSWALPSGGAALTWVSLTPYLGTGWVAYGALSGPPEYALDNGFVRLRGTIARTSGTEGTMFTVPLAIRPIYRQFGNYQGDSGNGQFEIVSTGVLQRWNGPTALCDFNNSGYWL